jgi:hypothetical protein
MSPILLPLAEKRTIPPLAEEIFFRPRHLAPCNNIDLNGKRIKMK